MLHLTNLFRTDPRGDYARLIVSASPRTGADPGITTALNFFNVDLSLLQSQLSVLTPQAPFALNEALSNAAAGHNAAMIAANQQTHQAPGEPRLGDRVRNAGYAFLRVAESIYGFGQNPLEAHAAFIIDWGNGPGGIQSPPGHRDNAIRPEFRDIGLALTPKAGSIPNLGPLVITQEFGNPASPRNFAVGSIYRDANSNRSFNAGEGLGGVTIVFVNAQGVSYTSTSYAAGGYQVELPDGNYTAIARGGGLNGTLIKRQVSVSGNNVWVNFIEGQSETLSLDRFEPNDLSPSATALQGIDQTITGLNLDRAGDTDRFRFTSPANGTATIDALFSQIAGDVDLLLLGPNQQTIASSAGRSDNERISVNLVRNGVYELVVSGFQNSISLGYQLEIDLPEIPLPPPADAEEANDSRGTAKLLGPQDRTFEGLTLHRETDEDWFGFLAGNNGTLAIDAVFSQVAGDVDLELLDFNGTKLTESISTTDREQLTIPVVVGQVYYLRVFGKNGDVSQGYTLAFDGPGIAPPQATGDIGVVDAGESLTIDVLTNDRSFADRPLENPIVELVGEPAANAPQWTVENNRVQVTTSTDHRGFYSRQYRVRDATNQVSAATTISLLVVIPGLQAWRNPVSPNDVDGDGRVTTRDALAIINLLNRNGASELPREAMSTGPFGYVDVDGNGRLEPLDALLVINALNQQGAAEPAIVVVPPMTSITPIDDRERDEGYEHMI
jgi:hypothetical protein